MPKQKKHTTKAAIRTATSAVSLDVPQTVHSMSYWLEKISPAVIGKLWKRLKADVKGVKEYEQATVSGRWVNGTTLNLGYQVVAIVYTTPDGFVLHFTVKDTSMSAGGTK